MRDAEPISRFDTTDAMPPEILTARELARRLIARDVPGGERRDVPDAAAAVHIAFERALGELVRWLGANGCHALLTRALAQTRPAHPALAEIRLLARAEQVLDGVAESTRIHGAIAIAQGLETLLVTLFDLLDRLIGLDMVAGLLERGEANHSQPEALAVTATDMSDIPENETPI